MRNKKEELDRSIGRHKFTFVWGAGAFVFIYQGSPWKDFSRMLASRPQGGSLFYFKVKAFPPINARDREEDYVPLVPWPYRASE